MADISGLAPGTGAGGADALISTGPTTTRERIAALDVLRGVAVLGILSLNIVAFAMPFGAYNNPGVYGGSDGANLWVWVVSNILFEGAFRTIFSMLFGAGVILLTKRAEDKGLVAIAADLYYRRTLWLLLIGTLHAYLIWAGDILFTYAVTGLLMYPFRRLHPRALIVLGLICLVMLAPKRLVFNGLLESSQAAYVEAMALEEAGQEVPPEMAAQVAGWRAKSMFFAPNAAAIEKEIGWHQGGYGEYLLNSAIQSNAMQSTYLMMFNIWDVSGMMLLGMALMKLGIVTAARSTRFYLGLLAASYALGLAVNAWETQAVIAVDFDYIAMMGTTYTYDIGRLAMALGHIALVMLVVKTGVLMWLVSALAAVGRMALSNYVAQSVICVVIFNGFGFGLFGEMERYQLYYVVLGVWVAELLWSPLWLNGFRFGPLEWVWRSLTYQELQPLRRYVLAD